METSHFRHQLSGRQRDFLVFLVFLLAHHGQVARALVVVEALIVLGEDAEDIRIARAILNFLRNDYGATLSELDALDDVERPRIRGDHPYRDTTALKHYLRARCYCETGRIADGEAIARKNSLTGLNFQPM